ncbi:MAG TPA: dienelactone hydrolase family protein [Caulobacteraceae bacterium]|jgi:carboxymethylenebutenolidase|nr:dienelactone hydrolase family protein [Caulobacteraceae bacterium]
MIERQIDIETPHGATTTFIVHPERGGPHPPILFFMDAPAIREELRDMARRLATGGYYVMLPNMYYRAGVMELGSLAAPGARERMFELMNSLTMQLVMSDAAALIGFLDADPAARAGGIGTLGYCMSGQYAVNAAASFPDRVTAAASMYGVRLVTETDDSPHLMARRTKAEIYFGCAETDHWAPLEMVEELRSSLADQGGRIEVELYQGVEHGFAFPQRPVYDKGAAERHWERLMALYRRRLG